MWIFKNARVKATMDIEEGQLDVNNNNIFNK